MKPISQQLSQTTKRDGDRDLPYEGIPIPVGTRQFVIPSLSVSQARKFWPNIMDLNKGLTIQEFPTKLGTILDIIHAAISRNYPEVTLDEVGDLLSADTAGELLGTVMQQSGFIARRRLPSVDDTPDPSVPADGNETLH